MCNGHDFIEKGKPDLADLAETRKVAEAAARGRAESTIGEGRSSVVTVLEPSGNVVTTLPSTSLLLPRELRPSQSPTPLPAEPLVIIDVAAEPVESSGDRSEEADLITLLDTAWEAKTNEARAAIAKLLAPVLGVAASSTRKQLVTALEAQSGIAPKDIPAWLREADLTHAVHAPVVAVEVKALPVVDQSDQTAPSRIIAAATVAPAVQAKPVEVVQSKADKALQLLETLKTVDISNAEIISAVAQLRVLLKLPAITHPDEEVLVKTIVGPKATHELATQLAKIKVERSALPSVLATALERFETKKK